MGKKGEKVSEKVKTHLGKKALQVMFPPLSRCSDVQGFWERGIYPPWVTARLANEDYLATVTFILSHTILSVLILSFTYQLLLLALCDLKLIVSAFILFPVIGQSVEEDRAL